MNNYDEVKYEIHNVDGDKIPVKILQVPTSWEGEFIVPDTVDSIGDRAFANCDKLTEIVFPHEIREIGNAAFLECTNLREFILPGSQSWLAKLGDSAFFGCTSLQRVIFPDNSISEILDETFEGCTSLREFVVPASVKMIYDSAFGGCTNLRMIVLPPNLDDISISAFRGCTNLHHIINHSELYKIGMTTCRAINYLGLCRVESYPIAYFTDEEHISLENFRMSFITDDSLTLKEAKQIYKLAKNMIFVAGGTKTIDTKDVCTFGGSQVRKASPREIDVNGFYMAKYPVTREQWKTVMGEDNDPSKYTVDDMDLPVFNVTYDDCQRFILKLNRLTGLKFSLPSVDQWDYAAHGGYRNDYDFQGIKREEIENVAWFGFDEPMPVGQKISNPLGLYDMFGNVSEYCIRQNTWDILKGGYIQSTRIQHPGGYTYHYEDYWSEFYRDSEYLPHGLRLVINIE